MLLKQVKKGEYFKLVYDGVVNSCVYVRGDYDKGSKRFSVYKFYDVNDERFLKGDTEVTTAFEF